MDYRLSAWICCAALGLITACGSSSESNLNDAAGGSAAASGNGSGVGGGGGVTAAGGTAVDSCASLGTDDLGNLLVEASPANDYSFSSTISIDTVPVAPRTTLTFDWSAVTSDFLKHPMSPTTDVDMVSLLMWSIDQQSFEQKLNDDALAQSDLVAITMLYTNQAITSGTTDDLTVFGQAIDPNDMIGYLDPSLYPPAQHTYTVMVVTGTTAGKGTRMVKVFTIDPSSTNTQVPIDSNSTQLAYQVDLHSLQPTQIPVGSNSIAVDWSSIALNAMGREFVTNKIDDVTVAHYDHTPTELEGLFLDLDEPGVATGKWEAPVSSGSSIVLSSLVDTSNSPFPGIDATGTWILGLRCTSCQNPAPWYLTVLRPCGG